MASSALTERQAILYSQRLRLDMGQEGLSSFRSDDVERYLDDALLLIECALIERKTEPNGQWRDGVKRAAQILEWLCQPELRLASVPLPLLAASAYQLAGLPAMALGLLKRTPDSDYSEILSCFLQGDFPGTQAALETYWKERYTSTSAQADSTENLELSNSLVHHVIMTLGSVCGYFRTGDDRLLNRALTKLDNLASALIHSRDSYSHLLAKLTAAGCRTFVENALWPRIEQLSSVSSANAAAALVQFGRAAFVNRRALVWPAQQAGISRLATQASFVLCTPTGSGKTTVATLGVVQSLFSEIDSTKDPSEESHGNIALYLVPSRALAAEVEQRLSQDLEGIAATPLVVTGLYGGSDWGPTDAWIQTERATAVICTFEKADALIRYLGVLFMDRVKLIVIDEAHMVEQDKGRLGSLQEGSSREFRVEQLCTRLLRAQDQYGFRMIALSAVAASAGPALARWFNGNQDALPVSSSYRSTRQMIGRLEVSESGDYAIHYDLMDGHSLGFKEGTSSQSPYVRSPFAALPGGLDNPDQPEARMKAPTLWAALQLASERPDGTRPSVLISLTQNVDTFAQTCAELMDSWSDAALPNYRALDETDETWNRCLASAEDYFTTGSVEYRLLVRGIVVHHGKMPGQLSRRLKMVIDKGLARVIIATSTLSEGVNIPVNYVLLPNLWRATSPLSIQEFSNLVGRAGRPGVATEGSALVVLPERRYGVHSRQRSAYLDIVDEIKVSSASESSATPEDRGSSPLACLLDELEKAWRIITGSTSVLEFETWLEQTAVGGGEQGAAYDYLDTLDGFLLSAIEEVEEIRKADLAPQEIEEELSRIWRKTYAFASSESESRLARLWLARGKALKKHFPDAEQRRRIYKTSLSPRSAASMLGYAQTIRKKLQDGANYVQFSAEERLAFIQDVLALLSNVPTFRIEGALGSGRSAVPWPILLRWWLSKASLATQPAPNRITKWFDFVSKNFIYRGAWGLGSVIGVLLDDGAGDDPIRALEIGDWPKSELPWIAFWLKELLMWGTLDPVAAFLLARGNALNRKEAEADALIYYESIQPTSGNEALDPRQIRDWVNATHGRLSRPSRLPVVDHPVTLAASMDEYQLKEMVVAPIAIDNTNHWLDSAGHHVASSPVEPDSLPQRPSAFMYRLIVQESRVVVEPYLSHR